MNEFAVVLMKKDSDNIITEEVATIDIGSDAEYINSIFITGDGDGEMLNLQLSTKSGVEDWEYTAIYDYYEEDKVLSEISELVGDKASVSICDEEFNPAWEYRFIIKDDDIDALEKVLKDIIQIHKDELQDVFLSIKDKEEEYL